MKLNPVAAWLLAASLPSLLDAAKYIQVDASSARQPPRRTLCILQQPNRPAASSSNHPFHSRIGRIMTHNHAGYQKRLDFIHDLLREQFKADVRRRSLSPWHV